MASTKPNRTARWATDGGTTLEPNSGEKDTGWITDEKPPARHMNFLQNMAFQWFRWFDERHDDGGTPADYVTHPEDPASGVAGKGTFRGGNSVGTDLAGGDGELSGGDGTGTGSSKAKLKASTAGSTGATPNVPEDYVVADGATGLVSFLKGLTNPNPLPSTVAPAAFRSTNREAVNAERNTTATSGAGAAIVTKTITSGEMVDGFGSALAFLAEDATSGEQEFGVIAGVRDGQDDNAQLVFSPSEGGPDPALRLRALGLAQFLKGLTSDGFVGNANGVGALGRGLISGGSFGTPITENGVGVHGVGSEGATTGYGAISQAAVTTPTRAAHLFVPMAVAPTAGEAGAVYPQKSVSTSHAKLYHHNGAEFERLVPQVFVKSSSPEDVNSGGGVVQVFASVYVIPADTLRVGSTIRIRAFGKHNNNVGGGTVKFGIILNSASATDITLVETTARTLTVDGEFFYIDVTVTTRAIGASATFNVDGLATHGVSGGAPDVTSAVAALPSSSTTGTITVEAQATFSISHASNVARLHSFYIDVT